MQPCHSCQRVLQVSDSMRDMTDITHICHTYDATTWNYLSALDVTDATVAKSISLCHIRLIGEQSGIEVLYLLWLICTLNSWKTCISSCAGQDTQIYEKDRNHTKKSSLSTEATWNVKALEYWKLGSWPHKRSPNGRILMAEDSQVPGRQRIRWSESMKKDMYCIVIEEAAGRRMGARTSEGTKSWRQ